MNKYVRRLTYAAVLCAITFLLTMFARVPLPGGIGYLNLGDVGVFLCALILPMPYAPLAAGVGAMLADLNGYAIYAPATLLIKGAMALVVYAFNRLFKGKLKSISLGIATLVVPIGYLLFELALYGGGAIVNVPLNLLQSVVGAGLAFGLYKLLEQRLPTL